MSRIIRTTITIDMYPDEDPFLETQDLTDEELLQYAKECFYDDIVSYTKYNELMDVINAEFIKE